MQSDSDGPTDVGKPAKPAEGAKRVDANRADEILRDIHRSIGVAAAYIGAGVAIAMAWFLYLLLAAFDVDIVARRTTTTTGQTNPRLLLGFAILVTALAIVWAIRSARKSRSLAARGIRTTGRIESVGLLAKHGLSPMTISYTAAGERRQVRMDLSNKDYVVGQSVSVLYDPERPGDCEVY